MKYRLRAEKLQSRSISRDRGPQTAIEGAGASIMGKIVGVSRAGWIKKRPKMHGIGVLERLPRRPFAQRRLEPLEGAWRR